MDAKIVLRRNMNIGTGAAENDNEFLSECFLITPEYASILDFADKKMILLGRTGCGKTALIKSVERDVDVFIPIKPDIFALQYINNIPFINALKQEGINLDIFYKFLWMHEIISNIIKQYFAYNKKDFLKILTETASNIGRVNQLKKYLEEYGNIFFEEQGAKKLTNEIEKKVAADMGYSDFLKIKGSLTQTQKQELQTKASQCVNSTQINQLKNVIALLKEYFERNKQRKIIVAIDDLDNHWIDEDSKYKLIHALLDAIRFFIDIPNLKILVSMRADLLAKTCEVMNRQNEKDDAFTLKINWTKQMLTAILDKRIGYLFRHKYQKNSNITFRDVFSCYIDEEAATDYILNRTMMRPRDAITFVNMCIARADGNSEITEETILSAEEDFRYDRLSSLKHEWNLNYPNIEDYIKAIYIFDYIFSYKEAMEKSDEIQNLLLASNKLDDPIVKKFVMCAKDDVLCKNESTKNLLNVLFTIGILGIFDKHNKSIYATPNRPSLNELDFTESLKFIIHPLFRK